MNDWLTMSELVAYSRLSLRQLHRAIARPERTLPSYLVEGRRLVRRSEYDAWATDVSPRSGVTPEEVLARIFSRKPRKRAQKHKTATDSLDATNVAR